MRRPRVARLGVVLAVVAFAIPGLAGAYSYWESYYQHRGFASVGLVPGAHRGNLVRVSFYSPSLGRESDYLAYLPPGYGTSHRRYPVYYLLHGSPGRPTVFFSVAFMGIRMDDLISEGRMRPMILIFPDGRIGGSTFSDSEWANTSSGNFMTYATDVVRDVDHRFDTLADRGQRVIAGFSAGAYGATNIALHYLRLFGNLESWSGYYRQTRSGVFAHASPAELAANSPLDYVRTLGPELAAKPLRAFLFVGRDDNVSPQTAPMAHALAVRRAQVSYALYRGGHDWELWHAHLNQMLILASRDVSQPLRRGNGTARALTPGVKPLPFGRGRHHHRRRHSRHRRRRLFLPRGVLPSPTPSGGAPLTASVLPVVGLGHHPRGGHAHGHGRLSLSTLLFGLLMALGSAALINLGFLLQHRGLSQRATTGLAASLRQAVRNPTWLSGQLLGWIGFGAQIVAVAIAPLSLVQAFAAGGLALSVPLAAVLFSHRITRGQLCAVLLIAASLAALPIGYGAARDHLHETPLGISMAVTVALGLTLAAFRSPPLRAIAAGAFYGAADAAIKAVSVGLRVHGASGLISVWTLVAALTTFAGFLAFQSALRDGRAITGISLMNALAALVALASGLVAFAESLGTDPVATVAHGIAIGVVLGCVPVLAGAQAEMAQAGEAVGTRGGTTPLPLTPHYESSR